MSSVREIAPAEAVEMVDRGAALLDTREPHEWQAGTIAGATLLRPAEVVTRAAELLPDKGRPVVVYCAAGARSLLAARQLAMLGYRDVVRVGVSEIESHDAGPLVS